MGSLSERSAKVLQLKKWEVLSLVWSVTTPPFLSLSLPQGRDKTKEDGGGSTSMSNLTS